MFGAGTARPNGLLGADEAPRGLAGRMHGAWIAFARNGNPGWASYDFTDCTVESFE